MTENTKSQIAHALRDLGLPEAWAEWAENMRVEHNFPQAGYWHDGTLASNSRITLVGDGVNIEAKARGSLRWLCDMLGGRAEPPPQPALPPKPPCYIAGPFRGPSHWDVAENIRRAEAVALAAWRSGLFSWVYCPHANTAHFQDAAPDEVWIEGHLEAMRAVHREGGVVLVTKGWAGSSGTKAELEEAHRIGMPAFQYQGDYCDMVAGVRMARRMCRDVHLTTWVTSEISQPLASYLTERAGRVK